MEQSTKTLGKALASEGIVSFSDVYSVEEREKIKSAIDPVMAGRSGEKRAYVHPDELLGLGLIPTLFSDRMKSILFSIMPDPVLYHFHIYEIAANNTNSHIFGDQLEGWHRDEDCAYFADKPTHVSIFVYLTDVGDGDGAFEFVPSKPSSWLKKGTPYISAEGKAGYTFAWNRPYFHRASPNRGPVRRRLLKISIQKNEFPSFHLGNKHFQALIKGVPEGNVEMDLLLGRYQGRTPPKAGTYASLPFSGLQTTNELKIESASLLYVQTRKALKRMKERLMSFIKPGGPEIPAYD